MPIKYLINIFYFEKKINLDSYSSNNNFLYNKDLNFLFEHFNSDKGQKFTNQYAQPIKRNFNELKAHGYSNYYENIFFKKKDQKINIMEIGSFYGNASAALYFYFKNANIHGADINPDMFKYTSSRVRSIYVDSSSEDSIKKEILDKNIYFDIIIEDASHRLKDQIITLFILFPTIKSGGYFIVEEVDFPETREDMRFNQKLPDLKTILNLICENKNFESAYVTDEQKDYFLKNFENIEIHKGNFNEIAIIKKK